MATLYDYLVSQAGAGQYGSMGQTQTEDSPIPEYIRDAEARTIEAAKGVAAEPYMAYGGPRVAGLSPEQQRAIQQQYGMAGQGVAGAGVGIGTLAGAAGYGTGAAQRGLTAEGYIAGGAGTAAGALGTLGTAFDASDQARAMAAAGFGSTAGTQGMAGGAYGLAGLGAQGVTGADIQGFMNPYAQQVTDVAARKFLEQGQTERQNLASKAAMAGGYGGSRAAVLQGMQMAKEQEGIGDLYTKGLSTAYESALAAAQEGRKRQIQGSQAQTQAGGLANQATLAQLQAAGQTTQAGQLARGATGEMRQLGALQNQLAGQQLKAADLQRNLMTDTASLGMNQIKAAEARQRIGATDVASQLGVAGLQQGIDQKSMDVAYADFLRQQQYPREQLDWLSGITQGSPVGSYGRPEAGVEGPSTWEKILGYGTQIAGMYGDYEDWW